MKWETLKIETGGLGHVEIERAGRTTILIVDGWHLRGSACDFHDNAVDLFELCS
jgi:hypothetical protein